MLWVVPGMIRMKASGIFVNHDMKNANMTKKFNESGKKIKTMVIIKTSWHTAEWNQVCAISIITAIMQGLGTFSSFSSFESTRECGTNWSPTPRISVQLTTIKNDAIKLHMMIWLGGSFHLLRHTSWWQPLDCRRLSLLSTSFESDKRWNDHKL